MASTYLRRTPSSTTNRKTFTFSAWVKRSNISSNQALFDVIGQDSNNKSTIQFNSDGTFKLLSFNGGGASVHLITSRVFRDTSAWYHVVVAVDTTQATSSDRVKYYINGEQITSFSTSTYPSQNLDFWFNTNTAHDLGSRIDVSYYFDGSMSHVHWIDGIAYDATAFGEYDANGVWKIKTSPSVTYGTNGFFILKDGNSVTDQSGNGNNFTVAGGTLTSTEDNPSNVFATWNSLEYANDNFSYANGNTYSSISSAGYNYVTSTLGASSGKYYCEMKANSGSSKWLFGIATHPSLSANDDYLGKDSDAWGYRADTGYLYNNQSSSSWGGTYDAGDIIGVAMDLDNNRLFFSKNGVWQNSADPTTSTGAITITAPSSTSTGFYHFAWGDIHATATHNMYANFGNGYFGTTAIASAGTNASGIGIFEYDVPSGYTALSTKGLNL
jgi:hypothetical protein